MLDYIHRSSMSQESFQEKVRVELDLLSPIIVGAKEKTPGTELDINKEEEKTGPTCRTGLSAE